LQFTITNEKFEIIDIKSFKPAKAKKLLEEQGMHVTLEAAKAILNFINLIATVAILTYFDGEQTHVPQADIELLQKGEKQRIRSLSLRNP
jgi:hypothetical protein